MKMTKSIIIAAFSVLLIGCGSENKKEKAIPKGVIPEAHLKALEKAKGMEKMLQEAEEKRRKAMEEQENI